MELPQQVTCCTGLQVERIADILQDAFWRPANLVISQRGPGGGYSPRGDDITVTEVITAVSKLPAHKTFEPILRALDDVRVSQLLRGDSPAP